MTRFVAFRLHAEGGDKAVLLGEVRCKGKTSDAQAKALAHMADRTVFPSVSQTCEIDPQGRVVLCTRSARDAYASLLALVGSPQDFVPSVSPLTVRWASTMDTVIAPVDPSRVSRFTVSAVYFLTDRAERGAGQGDGEEPSDDKVLRELASFELLQVIS